ncbi:MAG: ABC transporter permease [Propionibacteriaceae bacterium]|jgi:ribose transport system permease protein|nr:ABC transporter permease [Propionibacteriaceae bacterium]
MTEPTVAPTAESAVARSGRRLPGGVTRNLGLVIALVLICLVGFITAGGRFASVDNMMTILRLAAIVGVVSIGQTFVITAGGIDLSVGSMLGLATVWATTGANQYYANQTTWLLMVAVALVVGVAGGLLNGIMVAYGKIAPFMATLAMMVAAKGLAEWIANRQTQIVKVRGFETFFSANPLGIPMLVWIFAVVAAAGWVVYNRTTFGRRTVAIGGNLEASRLAGIKTNRHLVLLYALCGLTVGIAAVMMMGRTMAGTSTHGTLYEMDSIAAVVVGGTLLTGGRGTIFGTVIGVLIFTTLTNIFTQNNLPTSVQEITKGIIIVGAVLLQLRIAQRAKA